MRQGALAGIVGGQFGYSSVGPGESGLCGTPNIIFQGRAYQTILNNDDNSKRRHSNTVNKRMAMLRYTHWTVYWEQTGITQPQPL